MRVFHLKLVNLDVLVIYFHFISLEGVYPLLIDLRIPWTNLVSSLIRPWRFQKSYGFCWLSTPNLNIADDQTQYAASVYTNIVVPKFHPFLAIKSLRLINLNDLGVLLWDTNSIISRFWFWSKMTFKGNLSGIFHGLSCHRFGLPNLSLGDAREQNEWSWSRLIRIQIWSLQGLHKMSLN